MFLRFVNYFFKPYTLIVRYFGGIVVADIESRTFREVSSNEPTLGALRFWSERELREFAEKRGAFNLKKERDKTFSCTYYQY